MSSVYTYLKKFLNNYLLDAFIIIGFLLVVVGVAFAIKDFELVIGTTFVGTGLLLFFVGVFFIHQYRSYIRKKDRPPSLPEPDTLSLRPGNKFKIASPLRFIGDDTDLEKEIQELKAKKKELKAKLQQDSSRTQRITTTLRSLITGGKLAKDNESVEISSTNQEDVIEVKIGKGKKALFRAVKVGKNTKDKLLKNGTTLVTTAKNFKNVVKKTQVENPQEFYPVKLKTNPLLQLLSVLPTQFFSSSSIIADQVRKEVKLRNFEMEKIRENIDNIKEQIKETTDDEDKKNLYENNKHIFEADFLYQKNLGRLASFYLDKINKTKDKEVAKDLYLLYQTDKAIVLSKHMEYLAQKKKEVEDQKLKNDNEKNNEIKQKTIDAIENQQKNLENELESTISNVQVNITDSTTKTKIKNNLKEFLGSLEGVEETVELDVEEYVYKTLKQDHEKWKKEKEDWEEKNTEELRNEGYMATEI
jgi:hypothetical protein